MLLGDGQQGRTAAQAGRTPRGAFAYTAQERLVAALGRTTYAFMCLQWEALWLYAALTDRTDDEARLMAGTEPSVLALRLQARLADPGPESALVTDLRDWADGYAGCADLQQDVLLAHPGPDSLWSQPMDTPERLTLTDRPEDLLGYEHRFEAQAVEGATLRRALLAQRATAAG